jgi:hypothetical protein
VPDSLTVRLRVALDDAAFGIDPPCPLPTHLGCDGLRRMRVSISPRSASLVTSGIAYLLSESTELGKFLPQGPYSRTRLPSLLDGCPHGDHLVPRNVLPSLPAALSPAAVPIGPVRRSGGAVTTEFAAAPPFRLEAPRLAQQLTGIHLSPRSGIGMVNRHLRNPHAQ